MDDATRAINWIIENDDSFDFSRAAHDARRLKRLYDKYDKHSKLNDAQFLECVQLVRAIKANILLSPLR